MDMGGVQFGLALNAVCEVHSILDSGLVSSIGFETG
jgi:hypothetical protein